MAWATDSGNLTIIWFCEHESEWHWKLSDCSNDKLNNGKDRGGSNGFLKNRNICRWSMIFTCMIHCCWAVILSRIWVLLISCVVWQAVAQDRADRETYVCGLALSQGIIFHCRAGSGSIGRLHKTMRPTRKTSENLWAYQFWRGPNVKHPIVRCFGFFQDCDSASGPWRPGRAWWISP